MATSDLKPYGRVYLITNTVNGKKYVGQTVQSLRNRWSQHTGANGGCTALVNAVKKYGKPAFALSEICVCSTQEELNEQEALMVHLHQSLYPTGYNLKDGGGAFGKYVPSVKSRMSDFSRGLWLNDDYRRMQMEKKAANSIKAKAAKAASPETPRAAAKRMKSTPEHKEALRRAASKRMKARWEGTEFKNEDAKERHRTGVVLASQRQDVKTNQRAAQARVWADPVIRERKLEALRNAQPQRTAALNLAYQSPKLVEAARARAIKMWADPEYLAKMSTPERREQRRLQATGVKHSLESRKKMSDSRKGRTVTAETRAKISAAHKGTKRTDAARAKMSESARLRCRDRSG